jgi:hypothetical protein
MAYYGATLKFAQKSVSRISGKPTLIVRQIMLDKFGMEPVQKMEQADK